MTFYDVVNVKNIFVRLVLNRITNFFVIYLDLVKRLEEVRTENGSIEEIGNILMEWVCGGCYKTLQIIFIFTSFNYL